MSKARAKFHKFKGRTGDGQPVAKCGTRTPMHLIVSLDSDVTCVNCRKQMGYTT